LPASVEEHVDQELLAFRSSGRFDPGELCEPVSNVLAVACRDAERTRGPLVNVERDSHTFSMGRAYVG
jgi:hypothetical protein